MHKPYLLYLMECFDCAWAILIVSDGMLFWLERARRSHILQVYRHPTSIQTPYEYTDTCKYTVSRIQIQQKIQVQTPQVQVQTFQIQVQTPKMKVQTPKCKSRHLKYKSRHPKYKSRHPNTDFSVHMAPHSYQHTLAAVYIYIYILIRTCQST